MSILLEEREQVRRRGPLSYLRLACAKYLAVLRVSAANNLAYLMEVIFRALFLIALIYIIGELWKTTFANHGSLLPGFTVNAMVWYLAAAETIATSLPQLTRRIDQEVRSGELAYLLGRPCSYILYNYAHYLGERLVRLALNGIIAAGVALIFVGPPHFSLPGVAAWPLMVLLAISIEFVCYFAIGLLAFWTENTQPFSFIFSRLALVLGGVLAPIEIFPQPLRAIAQILPFSTILYGPSRVLVGFNAGLFAALVLQQAITLLIAGLLLLVLYTIATRRVSINGG
ncbi:MAG TPA: ABC-2 family transporter protein [Ktedonobacterales bacterium]|nr:ABC-2 family transporter protein [Ktedonobacterales bacterium]